MNPLLIPFNRAGFVGKEMEYIRQAVESGHLGGDGPFSQRCHALIEKELGITKVLLTPSCTHALEMSAILVGLKEGDEVIVPSFSFVSSANPFVLRGARPVFIDIRPDTLNMDEALLEKLITPRTKAIVPVHYAGVGCEMDTILRIAKSRGIAVIEDNAHGIFGKYKGKFLGTLGHLGAVSFHDTKNFTCGEGGALFVNDPKYLERAFIIRDKGTNRQRFLEGQVDKYTWVDLGSSFLMSDISAAILYAQLENRQKIQDRRKHIWNFYFNQLKSWAKEWGIGLPFVPDHCEQTYHLFYLLMPSADSRTSFIKHLKSKNISSTFHYIPLHLSAMGQQLGAKKKDCPQAESISERLVRLPFYYGLTDEDQQRVISEILKFKPAFSAAKSAP